MPASRTHSVRRPNPGRAKRGWAICPSRSVAPPRRGRRRVPRRLPTRRIPTFAPPGAQRAVPRPQPRRRRGTGQPAPRRANSRVLASRTSPRHVLSNFAAVPRTSRRAIEIPRSQTRCRARDGQPGRTRLLGMTGAANPLWRDRSNPCWRASRSRPGPVPLPHAARPKPSRSRPAGHCP